MNAIDPDGREPRRPFPSPSQRQEIRNNRLSIERNREPIRQLGQDINSAQTGVAALALAPAISVQLGLACGATCGAAAIGGQIGAGTETQSQIVSGEQIDGVAIALEGFEGAINGATAARNLVAGSVSAFVTGSGNQVIDNGRNGVPLGEGAIGNGATSAIGATIGGIIGQGSDIVANSSLTRSLGSLAGSFFGQGVTAGLEDRLSDDEN